jgi:hypothetical protein
MKMKMKKNQYRHWHYSEDSYIVIITYYRKTARRAM